MLEPDSDDTLSESTSGDSTVSPLMRPVLSEQKICSSFLKIIGSTLMSVCSDTFASESKLISLSLAHNRIVDLRTMVNASV